MKYGEMTFEQVKDAARKGWLVILPAGCTEQQGPHLTVDWDTWFAEGFAWALLNVPSAYTKSTRSCFQPCLSALLRSTGISEAGTWIYQQTFMKRLSSRR